MKARKSPRSRDMRLDLSSLGVGLVFLSILALLSPPLPSQLAGTALLLLGIYFLSCRRGKKPAEQWLAVKVLQSLILVDMGIVLMVVLPGSYFAASLLITLAGVLMFAYLKFKYFAQSQ